jgi:hypothetical protein
MDQHKAGKAPAGFKWYAALIGMAIASALIVDGFAWAPLFVLMLGGSVGMVIERRRARRAAGHDE